MKENIDYTNLKHKILKTNEDMISFYLQKDFRTMDFYRILLNNYIDKAIELKNKK
jgi:hypothetical protein